jgi:hypothetical protein
MRVASNMAGSCCRSSDNSDWTKRASDIAQYGAQDIASLSEAKRIMLPGGRLSHRSRINPADVDPLTREG